jgi:hypothetical protein
MCDVTILVSIVADYLFFSCQNGPLSSLPMVGPNFTAASSAYRHEAQIGLYHDVPRRRPSRLQPPLFSLESEAPYLSQPPLFSSESEAQVAQDGYTHQPSNNSRDGCQLLWCPPPSSVTAGPFCYQHGFSSADFVARQTCSVAQQENTIAQAQKVVQRYGRLRMYLLGLSVL